MLDSSNKLFNLDDHFGIAALSRYKVNSMTGHMRPIRHFNLELEALNLNLSSFKLYY